MTHRCGLVALAGRPNVGKSSILNAVLGQKLVITSSRPQTTRHRILGIHSRADAQIVFVDTPGLDRGGKRALNRAIQRAAIEALHEVDAIALVVEAGRWTEQDEHALTRIQALTEGRPLLLVVNKIDRLNRREDLLAELAGLAERGDFRALIPVSAKRRENLDQLVLALTAVLPEGPAWFPEEQITDRSERFLAAELVREQLFRHLGQELPYGLTVEIEQFEEEASGRRRIHGVIWIERAGHKPIIIGRGGQMLKTVGSEARLAMQRLFGAPVHLQLWVKQRSGWADDERALRSLGYEE